MSPTRAPRNGTDVSPHPLHKALRICNLMVVPVHTVAAERIFSGPTFAPQLFSRKPFMVAHGSVRQFVAQSRRFTNAFSFERCP